MIPETFKAFGDELTKIAFFQKLRSGFSDALHTGWHGTKAQPGIPAQPQTWMGQGLASAAERAQMGTLGKAVDTVSSLGGATKYLPVGGKGMMMLGTGLMAREALRPADASGLERSRAERLTGLAANTVGSLAGTGALLKTQLGRKHPFIANLVGGIGGGLGAEKLVTAPFKRSRMKNKKQRAAMEAQQREGLEEPSYPTGPTGRILQGIGRPA
jgi:hypothetical protein